MILRTFIATLVLILTSHSAVDAQDVTLKKSFWSGWQYSTDGQHYEKVGASANGLRMIMSGNEEALAELESYKSKKSTAFVIGIPGGILTGWPLGATVGGAEWQDSYTYMLAIGIPLSIVSMVIEGNATKNLKNAVNIYNGDELSVLERFDFGFAYFPESHAPSLRISYLF